MKTFYFLLFFFILVTASVFQVKANSVPDNVEFQVLKDLFDSLNGASWTTKTNWPAAGSWPSSATSAQFGTWFGISVYNGDITQISWSTNNLVGKIPASIHNLASLKYLIIIGNNIQGIPAEISQLSQLQTLQLSSDHLTGAFPEAICSIPSLTGLILTNNSLSGPLPSSLCNLTSLQSLQLDQNQFTGQVPSCLGNLHALRTLWLSINNFSGTLPDMFSGMTYLGDFRVSQNAQLTGPLPTSLGFSGAPLFRLAAASCKFTGTIPSTWSNLTALTDFQVNANQLEGALPSFIGNWTNLQTFGVATNKFTGPVPSTVSNLVHMASLQFSNNRFQGAFPASVGSMPLLTSLAMSNNYFTSLPVELLSLNLAFLYADNNDLTSIPDFGIYSNRTNLTLKLENNRLDFSQLERQLSKGIKSFTQTPQKTINDVTTQVLKTGNNFVLTARPATVNTTVNWEKLGADGTTWSNVNTKDQDAVANTFTRNNATKNDAGTYRWKATSTAMSATAIQSEPIFAETAQGFVMNNWMFRYKYDGRQRMTHKKVPGAALVYMVYDDRDRLVMTQDGEQRKSKKWTVTKYDVLNRPVVTAVYTHSTTLSQAGMDSLISKTSFAESFNGTGISGYTTTVFPTTNLEIQTATYYDKYSFVTDSLLYKGGQLKDQDSTYASSTTNKVTGTKVKVLEAPYYLITANYYDDKGRVIQTVSENFDAGIDRVTNTYDFIGRIMSTRTTHSVSNLHWQNVALMQVEGNLIRRLSSGSSGAWSVEKIPASTDGYAEATITETNTLRYWGLSDTNPSYSANNIDYCFYLGPTIQVMENGVSKQAFGSLVSGDRLRIARTGTTVKYYRNGSLLYTSATTSSSLLGAGLSFNSGGATILNVNLSTARTTQTTLQEFEYDHANRLLSTYHSINNGDTVLLAKNEYNELGQLIDKELHEKPGGDFAQSIDYRYNIRGWLTSMNGDLFGIDLHYNDTPSGLSNTAMFNGNISAMQWKVNLGLSDTSKRAYTFTYDPMNRLTGSAQKVFDTQWRSENAFSENNIEYDLNGNIQKLKRIGARGAIMDDLTYSYLDSLSTGNQLFKVSDNGDHKTGFTEDLDVYNDYTYDQNGNMLTDNNKGITIGYNMLNLPSTVSKSSTNENIQYYYDATGKKLSQVVKDAAGPKKSTDYHGEFIYENDSLKFTNHEEGRVVMTGAEPEYQYHLKDHLGNVRMTFTTKREVDISLATFETQTADFIDYDEAVTINSEIFDHTDTASTHYSARLNGTPSERYGLAKSLSVMPGDTINMQVFVKYLDTDTTETPELSAFLQSIVDHTAPIGTLKDGGLLGSSGGVLSPFWSLFTILSENDNDDAPKAYLNWLVFDRDYNLKDGGARQVSTTAAEHGENGLHEELSKQLVVKEAGYVYLYLSNDNYEMEHEVVEVYFDDFRVEHVKGPVVRSEDYYPFGLRYNSYSRENSLINRNKLFQEQEHIDDLGLNWDSFKWRNHQSDIGRFFILDPLSEVYTYNSPYAFSENRVINGREFEGMEWVAINNPDGSQTRRLTIQLSNSAGLSDKKLQKLISKMQNGFASVYSNNDANGELVVLPGGETGSFTVNLRKGQSTQIVDKDGQITRVQFEGGHTNALGQVRSNHLEITTHKDGMFRGMSDIVRSFLHESGHSAGLRHPWERGNQIADLKPGSNNYAQLILENLMNSGANENTTLARTSGTSLTDSQFSAIDSTIEENNKLPDEPDVFKYD